MTTTCPKGTCNRRLVRGRHWEPAAGATSYLITVYLVQPNKTAACGRRPAFHGRLAAGQHRRGAVLSEHDPAGQQRSGGHDQRHERGGQLQLPRVRAAGFRVGTDLRGTKINAKVRDAQLELIPYMLVIGQKEAEQGTVTVRDRLDALHQRTISVGQALADLTAEVEERRIRQTVKPMTAALGASEAVEANEY